MKSKFFSSGIILGILFIILTIIVAIRAFSGVDLSSTLILQAILPTVLDMPFSLFSLFGSAEIVLLIIFILWLLYRKLSIFYVLLGFVIFHVIELLQKTFVNHIGPPHELVRYYFNFSLPSSSVSPGYSYPSGHVGRTMFLSIIFLWIIWDSKKISLRKKQTIFAIIIIVDLIMFVSRVYLGEHWLSDVLGGMLLGSSVAILSLNFSNFRLKK